MRNSPVAFAIAALALLPSAANAARPCGTGDATASKSFQYELGDWRYDGADPNKANNPLATIAASLRIRNTPLYECVTQWPDTWAGWYNGGDKIIWSDCIFTGAGAGQDKTVSFAVDWKNRTFFFTHTFACSDRTGSDGLATGSIRLDIACDTSSNGGNYCVSANNTTTQPAHLLINTTIKQSTVVANTSSTCLDTSKGYQSWQLEQWSRQIQMPPGSSSAGFPQASSDTGPSFNLKNMPSNDRFNCTTSSRQNSTFLGSCEDAGPLKSSSASTVKFQFDPKLDMLTISQRWDCGNSSSFEATGVEYLQASCERSFNSDIFTCTAGPVWVGTGTL